MKRLIYICAFGLSLTLPAGCSSSKSETPTAPTPPVTPPAPALPVLTVEPDTTSPVGQAVAITYASRAQEPGKIAVAVTGYNLRNQLSNGTVGVFGVVGVLKWDDALLEVDGVGAGDFLGGNSQANCCRWTGPDAPGTYPFSVDRDDRSVATGSGELFLIRVKPRAGITAGASRIEMIPFKSNDSSVTFMPTVLLVPFRPPPAIKVDNVYGATITIRPGS